MLFGFARAAAEELLHNSFTETLLIESATSHRNDVDIDLSNTCKRYAPGPD